MSTRRKFFLAATALVGGLLGFGAVKGAGSVGAGTAAQQECCCPGCCCDDCAGGDRCCPCGQGCGENAAPVEK